MKVERKKGIENVRLVHNKKLFWIIIILGVILIAIIIFIIVNGKNNNSGDNQNNTGNECIVDSDCAPVCGCHPSSCIPIVNKGECERVFCTQECSGPLDCGVGSCGCVNGKCSIINNIK